MNLLSFLSFLILAITLLTMVFGVIAYFLYKAREKKKGEAEITYEQALEFENDKYIFFREGD
jgi:heme/copper-type cytochrome/quinol oxidase subunit 2